MSQNRPETRLQNSTEKKQRIGIIGGGPAALFMYKNLLDGDPQAYEVDIFESKKQLGVGFPYSMLGANAEHVTNVSANEIPELETTMSEWIFTVPEKELEKYDIDPSRFNEYKVLPRLLFGAYLSDQFALLLKRGEKTGLVTNLHLDSFVTDITKKEDGEVWIETIDKTWQRYDKVIVCIGHHWPVKNEGKVKGYFDSPYPPAKLMRRFNHPVAIKGASLTAIDAIRTLARNNGSFNRDEKNVLTYKVSEGSEKFKLSLHSLDGLLPAIRFHLEDSHLSKDDLLSQREINNNIKVNEGFLELDFIFENDFKKPLQEKDPAFYEKIRDMRMEEFVEMIMDRREKADPMELFKAEYREAEKSIKRQESVHWKEMLAILSFAMNYPAKHFSAEDMIRLKKVLKPLISIVIAFVPQSSCEEMIAIHDSGHLEIIAVDSKSTSEPAKEGGIIYQYKDSNGKSVSNYFETFINCVGQPEIPFEHFPFPSLMQSGTVTQATIEFRSDETGCNEMEQGNKDVEKTGEKYFLRVAGITINDMFQVIDDKGKACNQIYMMAVPYIAGYNPDYSGLDFCEEASGIIIKSLKN